MHRKVIFFILAFLIGGCTTIYNPATGRKETFFIDSRTEVSLGQDMAKQINSEMKLVTDPIMYQRLQRLAHRVAAVSDRQDVTYKFNIVDDKVFNAFAIPGGIVYINSGLMQAADDDELAAVLGHEVGHIAARHSVKRLQAVLGYQLITSIALGGEEKRQVLQAVDVVFNVVTLGYGRKDELLADKLGVKYANAAGFNPSGMITLLQKLKKESRETGINLVFLSSHPPIEERIKLVEQEIASLNK